MKGKPPQLGRRMISGSQSTGLGGLERRCKEESGIKSDFNENTKKFGGSESTAHPFSDGRVFGRANGS